MTGPTMFWCSAFVLKTELDCRGEHAKVCSNTGTERHLCLSIGLGRNSRQQCRETNTIVHNSLVMADGDFAVVGLDITEEAGGP